MTALAFPKPAATADRITRRRRRDRALSDARDQVWVRDQYQCRVCTVPVSKSLLAPLERRGEVHHLVPRSRSKALRADTRNLVLLCISGNADKGLHWERPR